MITINGYTDNIKKEDILNVINQFAKTTVEARGIKIYVIYGIEYASSQAVNSLLKFLEEPPANTYAILTTRAINLLLPTIRSRCQTYILKSNLQLFDEKLSKFSLTLEQKEIIRGVYYNYDEVMQDLHEAIFTTVYE
jgi:DNA polymerase-3 subunit delta'